MFACSAILLYFSFLSFLLFPKVISFDKIPLQIPENPLVTTEYVDSKILFITSADGKIYAYDMEKHSLKWLADLGLTLQKWQQGKDTRLEDNDIMLIPSQDGKMQLFSPREGFQKYEKSHLKEAFQVCFSTGKTKYFSKMSEKLLMIDLNKGVFWDMDEGVSHLEGSRMDTFGVLRIRKYRYSAFDFQNMKEKWSLQTSDIDFYTYFQFLNHGNTPNPHKYLQNYKILCKGGNVIEILRSRDETFLRSIETENEVVSVHSLEPSGGFFYLKIESVGDLSMRETSLSTLIEKDILRKHADGEDGSNGLAVYTGPDESQDEYCGASTSTSSELQLSKSTAYNESVLDCVKTYINKKTAIDIPRNVVQDDRDMLPFENDDERNKQHQYANPVMFLGIIVSMCLAVFASVALERRRNRSKKKSVSTEMETSAGNNENTSTGGSISSSKGKSKRDGQTNDDSHKDKEKKKKMKKREFEVFSKEILGMGSHGTVVFEGEFQGKRIAVKRFLKCYVEAAKSEINLLMSTEHPNIIRYYLYEEDQEFIYLILERCLCSLRNFVDYFKKGEKIKEKENDLEMMENGVKGVINYRQAIRKVYKEKSLTIELTKKIISDCAKGLHYVHKEGIVHRDIKPENILLSHSLDAKIADFGISRVLKADEERFLTEAGTFGWKAPEMFRVEGAKSKAVDIFSLGCTYYYIYTKGCHPFGDTHERESNILNNKYKMENLDDFDLEHLIRGMIRLNPEERPTIEEVLNHPYFWDEGKKLAFMQDFSDFISSTDPKLGKLFEDHCQAKQVITVPWNKALDQNLIKDLTSFRYYDFRSVRELIRVIRNKKNHYYELPEETREALGKMPVGVWNYFNVRFPRLFMHAYIFCKENNVELSSMF